MSPPAEPSTGEYQSWEPNIASEEFRARQIDGHSVLQGDAVQGAIP
jgi:hypothetical protein